MNSSFMVVSGNLVKGHQVASGKSPSSPYSAGTIAMQAPLFKSRGLDLEGFYFGTLNVDIDPKLFKLKKGHFHFEKLAWAEGFPPEDFSFVACEVGVDSAWRKGLIYYPHPETKIGHFQSPSIMEVITEYIAEVTYGCEIKLKFSQNNIHIIQ